MATAAQKTSARALFSFISLEEAATRASTRDVASRVFDEIRLAVCVQVGEYALTRLQGNHQSSQSTALFVWTNLHADKPQPMARIMSDIEVFMRNKRRYESLMKQYNPLYGMSEQDRIRATARTVGLDIPKEQGGSA